MMRCRCLVFQARLGVIGIVTMLTRLAYCDVGLALQATLGVIGIVNTIMWLTFETRLTCGMSQTSSRMSVDAINKV